MGRKINEAKEYHQVALKIFEVSGNADAGKMAKMARAKGNLGNAHRLAGDLEMARMYLQKARDEMVRLHGPKHFLVARILNDLGYVYRDTNDLETAQQLFEEALEIRERHFGKDHLQVATTLFNLGRVYQQMARHDRSHEFLERGREIYVSYFGEDHHLLAQYYQYVGLLKVHKRDFDKGIENLEKSIVLFSKVFGERSQDVALAHMDLGMAFKMRKQHRETIKHLATAREIFEDIYSNHHHPHILHISSILNSLPIDQDIGVSRLPSFVDPEDKGPGVHMGWVANEHKRLHWEIGELKKREDRMTGSFFKEVLKAQEEIKREMEGLKREKIDMAVELAVAKLSQQYLVFALVCVLASVFFLLAFARS